MEGVFVSLGHPPEHKLLKICCDLRIAEILTVLVAGGLD